MQAKISLGLGSFLICGTLLGAQEQVVERNGNLNVNVIDRKVIVNDKVVKTIPEGEPISVEGGGMGADIDGDKIGAKIGDMGVKIDGDSIGVNVGSLLKGALKNINSEDSKEEKEFFKGDFFDD